MVLLTLLLPGVMETTGRLIGGNGLERRRFVPFFRDNRLAWRCPSVVCVGGPLVLLGRRALWLCNRSYFDLIGGKIECGINYIGLAAMTHNKKKKEREV